MIELEKVGLFLIPKFSAEVKVFGGAVVFKTDDPTVVEICNDFIDIKLPKRYRNYEPEVWLSFVRVKSGEAIPIWGNITDVPVVLENEEFIFLEYLFQKNLRENIKENASIVRKTTFLDPQG